MKRLTVSIDGPAGAGKSTAARQVARQLDYLYIDTGAMYRAVALKADREGVPPDDPEAMAGLAARSDIRLEPAESGGVRVFLDGVEVSEAIRTPEMSALSSRVSVVPGVRQEMVRRQREMGRDGGVVMEGRDIGTVVFPEAEVKVFLSASPDERARRRCEELRARGLETDQAAVLAEIRERDARDSRRAASPLRPAADAVRIDTDGLPIGEVVRRILDLCEAARRRNGGKPPTASRPSTR